MILLVAGTAPSSQGALLALFGIDEEALDERDLPLLAAKPALGLVEEPLDLAMLAGDARDGEARALPDLVVVDLRDRLRRRGCCSCAFAERT